MTTEELKTFSQRVSQLQEHVATEEATKTSLVAPFF